MKCIDRATGEEIYFNTTLPKGIGSWAGEGDAMKAIGAKIADEFSRNFFLQHVTVTGRKVTLHRRRLAGRRPKTRCCASSIGLPAVITATPRRQRASRASTTCSSRAAAPKATSSRPAC